MQSENLYIPQSDDLPDDMSEARIIGYEVEILAIEEITLTEYDNPIEFF